MKRSRNWLWIVAKQNIGHLAWCMLLWAEPCTVIVWLLIRWKSTNWARLHTCHFTTLIDLKILSCLFAACRLYLPTQATYQTNARSSLSNCICLAVRISAYSSYNLRESRSTARCFLTHEPLVSIWHELTLYTELCSLQLVFVIEWFTHVLCILVHNPTWYFWMLCVDVLVQHLIFQWY